MKNISVAKLILLSIRETIVPLIIFAALGVMVDYIFFCVVFLIICVFIQGYSRALIDHITWQK